MTEPTKATPAQDARPMIIWCSPRTLSHAFERMIRARNDFDTVLAEPFNDSWYYGPERGTHRDLDYRPDCTYDAAFRTIREASETGRVFIRDHPIHLPSQYFTLATLQMFHGSFLIRDPAYAFPSYYKQRPDLTEHEGGVIGLHRAWQMLRGAGEDLPIVDATDIQRDPQGYVGAWCDAVGLERNDGALHWESRTYESWEKWPQWVQTVSRSTGFRPPPTEFPVVTDERLARLIDSSRRLYREMAAHKIVV